MKVLTRDMTKQLDAVSQRWVWLLTFRSLALALALWCGLATLWAAALRRGWIDGPRTGVPFGVILAGAGVLGVAVILVASVAANLDRRRLARALEAVHPPLLDRLNTVVHLERAARSNRYLDAYFPRIEQQATELLRGKRSGARAYPAWPTLLCVVFAAGCVTAASWFFAHYPPWRYLNAAKAPRLVVAPPEDKSGFELAPSKAEELSGANQIWGEVRLTEPGRDLKLTKVDVAALRIEAASRQTLQKAGWTYAVNGGEPKEQALPAPGEPNYAVYTPTLYLDELDVSDWDVVSYFATAATDKGSYGSEIYFIEIRPFREDLEKLPGGGEKGSAGKTLSELSALIDRQQEILRQTHRHIATNYESEEMRKQDRGKLSGAEDELRDSTEQTYGRIAAKLENQPVGEILDHLAQGGEAMRHAVAALNDDAAPDGQRHEGTALTELVATRKKFQKFVTEHPEAFGDGQQEPTPPVASTVKGMSSFTEFHNRQKAAQAAMDKLLEEQKKLSDAVQPAASSAIKGFAPAQEKINKALADLEKNQPELFRGTDEELAAAKAAGETALKALVIDRGAENSERRAVDRMQDLQRAVASHSGQRSVADAYRLKQLLDQEIRQLDQMQQPGSGQPGQPQSNPGGKPPDGQPGDQNPGASQSSSGDKRPSGQPQPGGAKPGGGQTTPGERAEARQLAEAAKTTTHDLKQLVEREMGSSALGQGAELRQSLSNDSQAKLDANLAAMAQATDAAARQAAASRAGQGMKAISEAFEKSVPDTAQKGRAQDSLGTKDGDALDKAMQELASMAAQKESGRAVPSGDAAKQQAQALADLQQGLSGGQAGDARNASGSDSNDPGAGKEVAALLAEAKKTLSPGDSAEDAAALRRLIDAIEKFRVETADKREKKEVQSEVTHIDPDRISPAYHDRVQRYYKKLSEN